jgi:hypothetical protein
VRRDCLHADVDSFLAPANGTVITVLTLLRYPFVNDRPRRPKLIA